MGAAALLAATVLLAVGGGWAVPWNGSGRWFGSGGEEASASRTAVDISYETTAVPDDAAHRLALHQGPVGAGVGSSAADELGASPLGATPLGASPLGAGLPVGGEGDGELFLNPAGLRNLTGTEIEAVLDLLDQGTEGSASI